MFTVPQRNVLSSGKAPPPALSLVNLAKLWFSPGILKICRLTPRITVLESGLEKILSNQFHTVAVNIALHELVEQCRSGDPDCAMELVRRYQHRVFGLCLRMLGHRQDAEDATQETFVRVLRNLHRWEPARDFVPWLLAIAGNRCRTRLAQRGRMPRVDALPAADVPGARAQSCGLKWQANLELGEEIAWAIDSLDEKSREPFLMFHQHQLSFQQIADQLDLPLGTVTTRVHRARKHVARTLSRRGVVDGDCRH